MESISRTIIFRVLVLSMPVTGFHTKKGGNKGQSLAYLGSVKKK